MDEIAFDDFQKNPENINQYLKVFKLENGRKFITYKKLHDLYDIFKTYHNRLRQVGCNIAKGDLLIDIGAHHGIVSFGFAALGMKVISYEPNPINNHIFSRNLELNVDLKVKLLSNAISEQKGHLIFNFGKTSTTGALEGSKNPWKKTETTVSVESLALKDILRQTDKVKILKVDCEGGEYLAFKNTSKKTLDHIEYIYMEAHTTDLFSPSDIQEILKSKGFNVLNCWDGPHGTEELVAKRNG